VLSLPSLNSVALKVNSLPFKVNLLTSAPPTIAKPVNWKKIFFIGVAVSHPESQGVVSNNRDD
jgi:hypothetical protein